MVGDRSKPVKRIRWATQRATGNKADRKREKILDRFHRRKAAADEKATEGPLDAAADHPTADTATDGEAVGRRIFFNVALPDDARDAQGYPTSNFGRNKIRTSKYTALSFIPKNLWFQFHNIANVYFLFLIILSFFSIFGAASPGLASLPLIFILIVTAIKDAIEDWRRTVLDNELNNTSIRRLVDFNNVNVSTGDISIWRRFKKANTRFIKLTYSLIKRRRPSDDQTDESYADRALDQSRHSMETRNSVAMSRSSFHSARSQAHRHSIQMTPVPSPTPGQRPPEHTEATRANNVSFERPRGVRNLQPPRQAHDERPVSHVGRRDYGNVINPYKAAPGRARFKVDYWKNVQVGDFIRIYDNEQVPADIVVLATSDPDGACYVETKNLDGETNLKVRQALHCGRTVKRARDCEKAEFMIESEGAHANLYSYSGVVRWQQHDRNDPEDPTPTDMAEPISINNILLRGCSVRNTEWVLGVVLFTGQETKIMLNSGVTPSKRAKLSQELNWNITYNFVILFFMCLVSGIAQGVHWAQGNNSLDYFEFGSYAKNHTLDGFITFWAAIILYQNLVPISLYITLEIIRTAQAYFIYSDVAMYYEKIDYPCTPKSWNISDDLGQIEYIFSDKTGTLTQNVMEFKKCTINGVPYGEAYTEALAGMQRRQGINVEEESAKAHEQISRDRIRMLAAIRNLHDNPYLRDEELTFVAPDFVSDLEGESGDTQKTANYNFMLALALCHTVITERTPGEPPRIEFKAQSPDEAALVATARDCGFTVLGRHGDEIILNLLGRESRFTVLNTLEFNSSRKRMSAIIRTPEGKLMLYCKGADTVIYSRLNPGQQAELRKSTGEHLEMFAREGLRTLCLAVRELSEDDYQEWNKRHDVAAAAVTEREDKLDAIADEIERNLTLLGGTAIEDRLQDGVPDAIALLGQAGIKLWVLTGDKVETAINIGFSCNLLDNEMDLIVFKIEDEKLETAEKDLDNHLATFGLTGSDEELVRAKSNHEAPAPTHAVIIDGESLKLVLDQRLRQKFLILCKQCKSVICCRVSPSQKAAVVQLVKDGLDVMTLSIGDGANDVAMIQEANVGVGIAGEEGRQAVMSSDYAIGQFRYLSRLILVHGRWSYRRLAETIANFFYKNIVWVFALFWFNVFDNFNGTYLFDYTYILMYNLAFTSLPVILMGVLDQDVSDKVSLAVPQLYRRGIERKEWTQTKFWLYMLDGFYQSVIVWFFVYLTFKPGRFLTSNGLQVDDLKRLGVYVMHPAVIIVNLYILLNTYRWDWLILLVVSISIFLIWFWTGVYTSSTASFQFYKAAAEVYSQLSFWTVISVTVVAALLPRFSIKAFQKLFMPRDIDIVREQVRQGKFDYLKDVDAYVPPTIKKKGMDSDNTSPKTSERALHNSNLPEEERPIYPPSVAPTTNTHHHPRSNGGSDGTNFTDHNRPSLDRPPLSPDRPRPSFDRFKRTMDRTRPSFEASRDFTSAALLTRVESSQSGHKLARAR